MCHCLSELCMWKSHPRQQSLLRGQYNTYLFRCGWIWIPYSLFFITHYTTWYNNDLRHQTLSGRSRSSVSMIIALCMSGTQPVVYPVHPHVGRKQYIEDRADPMWHCNSTPWCWPCNMWHTSKWRKARCKSICRMSCSYAVICMWWMMIYMIYIHVRTVFSIDSRLIDWLVQPLSISCFVTSSYRIVSSHIPISQRYNIISFDYRLYNH